MKKTKKIAVVLSVLLVVVLGVVLLVATNKESIILSDNQRYVYAYITSIQGNEITYMEVEEDVITALLEESKEEKNEESTEKNQEDDDSRNSSGEKSTEKTERGKENGANMSEKPDMSNMPSDGEKPDMNNKQSSDIGGITSTVTMYIPVGTTVHTAADVSTTFSRLVSGDLVKILVETNDTEEDVILEIWMLQ